MEFCAEDIERYKQEMRTYARRAGYSVDPPEADAPPPVLTPASPPVEEPEEEAAEPAAENPFGILGIEIGGAEEDPPPEDSEADIKDEDG